MSKTPDETPEFPVPDGTVEEIPGTNDDGTRRVDGLRGRHGEWSAHIDYQKRHEVRLCHQGRKKMESKGQLAFERAAELAAHFHSKGHDPARLPG